LNEEAAAPREERKVVTVLFADLVGFTQLAESMDPEEVRAFLAPFHDRLRVDLERFGGTVEKFIGDAVMALFGVPKAHEDDPERAVRAAFAIRDWAAEQKELHVRIAVNTGEALITLGNRPERGEAVAAGDVVNTAARLQAAAPLNGILVGERTYRATREAFEYRAPDAVEAKGKAEPVRVWEALQPRARVVSLDQGRTPLVGRARELELLVSTLARAREERTSQLVTLVGVPGIGKSRLVSELRQVVEQEPELITWRQGGSLPYGDGVSFWALGEMMKQQAGILESDSREQAAEKLRRAVRARVDDDADWIEAQLRPLVGLSAEQDASGERGEPATAWRRFFEALAEQRPTVLVFEDLHWADDGLLDFVDYLVDRASGVPLLVLATTRPELLERRPGWGAAKPNALMLSLPPLADDETARLVAALLERPLVEAETQRELLGRIGGNPLYAEQYARVLVERGGLEEPSETVQGIIAARLDTLSDDEKRLLQDAAVVGTVFWVGAVEAIDDFPPGRASELLHRLERKEFVQRSRRSSVAGETEYAFRHVLLRDGAYGQIPRALRAKKHRGAARWIELLGRLEDHAEMLAHHYVRAVEYAEALGIHDTELVERARVALRAAGDRALSLASYAAASRFYGAALDAWPRDDPDRLWLLVSAGRARHAADGAGLDLLVEGFEELRTRGDVDGAAEVAVELSRYFWFGADRDLAYAYIDRALELTKGRGASRARAHALVERAGYHMNASEHDSAIRLAREALPLTEALGTDDLRVRALDVMGYSRVLSGDAGGLEDSRRAIALGRESNSVSRLIVAEWNSYHIRFFLGQLAATSGDLELFRSDVDRYGTADLRRHGNALEAHNAVLHGRWKEAARILDQVLAEAAAGSLHYADPSCGALRALIDLARGDPESAATNSETSVERARRMKDPQILAPALVVRGMVLLAQGRREDAAKLASELLARGPFLVLVLLEFVPAATPIHFAWLLRDLRREDDLFRALERAPVTPWVDAARAIAASAFAESVLLATKMGAPAVEAYVRLRAGEAMLAAGGHAEALVQLEPALDFYRSVGATHYVRKAEALIATSTHPNRRAAVKP
jgi:class 3 adenylate cyclase/tetratricopeptide (TPR) repeat protein